MSSKPLSWSELHLWETSPEEHHQRYIQGIKSPTTPQQEFGTIIHTTIADRKFPWIKELVVKQRPVQEQHIARKILNKIETKRPKESEVFLVAQTFNGIPLVAIFDGLDKENRILIEYKTSGGAYWNQTTVDRHGQLTFYAYVYHLKFHSYFREIQLHRMHTKSGNVKTFYTARGPKDIEDMKNRVQYCYDQLMKQGLWHLRKSNRNQDKTIALKFTSADQEKKEGLVDLPKNQSIVGES